MHKARRKLNARVAFLFVLVSFSPIANLAAREAPFAAHMITAAADSASSVAAAAAGAGNAPTPAAAGNRVVLESNVSTKETLTADGAFDFGVPLVDGSTYTVGGTLSGLAAGNSLVLQNNASDSLTLTANGAFTFDSALADGKEYEITVVTQPDNPSQLCSVTNSSGILTGMNVSNIEVNCVDRFQLMVAINGEGTVSSEPAGIDCGADCSEDFTKDSSVRLIATPASGFVLEFWSGDCAGTDNGCDLEMNSSKNVVAYFIPDPEACSGADVLVDDITFSTGSMTHCKGSNSIYTAGSVQVETGAEVIFESPELSLTPDFRVIKGGEFQAITPLQIDEICIEESACSFYELSIEVSNHYDGHIAPWARHVYHFRSPTRESLAPDENRYIRFSVIDHGAAVQVNLGLSKVKGRTQPGSGEAAECFTGPGTQLNLAMATDDEYTNCIMEFDTDYYFTIENVDSSTNGDYRFTFGKSDPY